MGTKNRGQRGKQSKMYIDDAQLNKFAKFRRSIDRRIVLMTLIRLQFIVEAILILIINVIMIKKYFVRNIDYTTLQLALIIIIYYKLVDLLIVKFGNNVPLLSSSIISRLTIILSLITTFIVSFITLDAA